MCVGVGVVLKIKNFSSIWSRSSFEDIDFE